ncbi:acyl-CoA/acyl-ACP dehydrogenase [Myxococcota bacterium]|nr:acyl-CoA/acyl-ACP dehydrogenase [Myxococcota bacterium]
MNLDLTETQRMMQESLSGFLEAHVSLDQIRDLERKQGWDEVLWNRLAEQGWLELVARGGGEEGGLVDLALAVECFARRAALVPFLEVAVCGRVLAASEVDPSWCSKIAEGNVIVIPALLEVADDWRRIEATVTSAGLLSGVKCFVDYGVQATHHLVAAKQDGQIGLFLVEAEGARCEPSKTIGRTPSGQVTYSAVPAQRVGGREAFTDLVLWARSLAALQCVGAMEEALEKTVRYARLREQFGQPIGRFQAVRHHCSDMAIRIASSRDLCFEALSALQAGDRDPLRPAAAKASASRAAPEVLMLAHQIHGGNGVIEENDLYFFTLRGKERSLAWGTVDECLEIIAERVEEPVDWL